MVNPEELKDVGYWREPKKDGYWPKGQPDRPEYHLPDPTTLVDPDCEKDNRDKIIAYLKSGKECAAYKGFSWCRFKCGISDTQMGTTDLTDGKWAWPEGLYHYVERHDVKLPDEFIEHMKSKNWVVE